MALFREKIETGILGVFPVGCKEETPNLEQRGLDSGLGNHYCSEAKLSFFEMLFGSILTYGCPIWPDAALTYIPKVQTASSQ
jgi:hypothetical protein